MKFYASAVSVSILLGVVAGCEGADAGDGDAAGSHGGAVDAPPDHCDPDRRGIAYLATVDGAVAQPADSADPDAAPVPCIQLTGLGSAENTMAIDGDGAMYVAPVFTAEGNGILRSRDGGDSWQTVLPGDAGGADHGRAQPVMYMDPATDRVLFATPVAGMTGEGFALSLTDDGGDSWRSTTMGEGTADWLKFVSGPSTTAAAARAMYAISPAPISTPSPLLEQPHHQQVQRSYDGGDSWETVGGEALSIVPADHGCTDSEWVIYGGGVVESSGRVHYGLRRCQRLGIATSDDDGETWSLTDVPGAELPAYGGLLSHIEMPNLLVPEPLAIDSDDNLYALWGGADGLLRIAVSTDGGERWSDALVASAPDVVHAVYPHAVTAASGTLAITYYGSVDGVRYDGYLAQSRNALDEEPTFWTVTVNDPAQPLFSDGFDVGYAALLSGGDLVEITHVRYDARGDLWAAYSKDMCPGTAQGDPCEWDVDAHAGSHFQGAIGRMAFP